MLGQRSITIFLSQWGGNALLMLSGIIVARVLGPNEVGRMAFFMSSLGLFFMITSLGFAQTHQKRLAEGMDPKACVGTFTWLLVALNLIAVTVAVIAWPYVKNIFVGAHTGLLYGLFLAQVCMLNLNQIPTNTFYGRQEFVKAAAVIGISRLVRLLLVALVLVIHPNLVVLAVCLLTESLTAFVLGGILSGSFRWTSRPTRESVASYWSYAKPLAFISPLNIIVENADRVMLGSRFIPAELGFYNVAINLFEGMKSLPSAVITALFPRLTSDYHREGVQTAAASFYVAQRKLLLAASPIAIIGSVWATNIIALIYGPPFVRTGPMLTVFFCLFWFICLASPYHYVLYASEKHKALVWISPVANGLYGIALWFLCSPALGLGGVGAAIAFGIPHLLAFPPVLFNAIRRSGIGVPVSTVAHSLVVVAILAVGVVVQFHVSAVLLKAAVTTGLLVLYFTLMIVLRQLKGDDIRYVFHVIHPIRYLHHVKAELKGGGTVR